MPSIINTNINSLTAQSNLNKSQASLSTSIQRLSSGLRINSAADDAAGYAIAQGFTSQINGTNQAIQNANNGISLSQTADGALNQVTSDLQTIRQLAVESSNATNSASDRAALQQQVSQLTGDISTIGSTTQFNGLNLLDGTYSNQNFQVGSNVGDTIGVSIANAQASALGASTLSSGSGILTAGTAGTASLTGSILVDGQTITNAGATSVANVVANINNATASTGVTAALSTSNIDTASYAADAVNSNTIQINGVGIALAAGSTIAQAATAINAVSAQTGVTASAAGATLTFNSANAATFTLSDDAANGVLSNFNGTGNASKKSATFSAGITLSSNLGSTPTVSEGSGTTANNLQLLSGLTVNTTSSASNVTVNGSNQTFTNENITNLSVGGGASVTLINCVVSNLTMGGGGGLTATGSIINGTSFGGGGNITATNSSLTNIAVGGGGGVNATNSYLSGVTIGGGGSITNTSPASGGSSANPLSALYQVSTLDVSTAQGAQNAIATADYALQQVASIAAQLGAIQNRFTATVTNLQTASTNLSSSLSTVQDANFASETANLSRAQVLQQAGTAVLAQANQIPNQVLTLLR